MLRFLILVLMPVFTFAVQPPPNINRESKAPFISADAFRAYSDFAYDELDSSLDPLSVTYGSTVYVKGDAPYFDDFFAKIHPLIPVKYILITHCNDTDAPGPFYPFLDDEKLIAWFAENYDGYKHPKMHPLPIGLANYCWNSGNVGTLQEVISRKYRKVHLAHLCFSTWTYPVERGMVKEKFCNADFVHCTEQVPFLEYLKDAASSKFSIAPRGNALDTHRLWEGFYIGTIPIVKTSSLDVLYEGLPVVIVQDWDEVTEEFLNAKYEEMTNKTYQMEKIWMDYWTRLIDSYKPK